jgi:hypothetical protein
MEVVATAFGVHRNQDRFIPSWGPTVGLGPFPLYLSVLTEPIGCRLRSP